MQEAFHKRQPGGTDPFASQAQAWVFPVLSPGVLRAALCKRRQPRPPGLGPRFSRLWLSRRVGRGSGLCRSSVARPSLAKQGGRVLTPTGPFSPPHTRVGSVITVQSRCRPFFAGQDMVPEQTLQVQEADEARRGRPGGQRAGEWPGLVRGLPAGTARLESELLVWEELREQRRLLRPQLHVLVPFSAPRSYAAASAHVSLSVRHHPPPSRLSRPGPSRLQVSPPFRGPWAGSRRAQRWGVKRKRKRNS